VLKIGKYSVCVLDLLTDSRTGRLSASKVWLHIANGIMSHVMLTHDAVDWELMTAFGGIVGGSYVAILFFKLRWGNTGADFHGSVASNMLDTARLEGEPPDDEPCEGNDGAGAKPKGRVRGKRKKA
jgi:hypothetical protein